VTQTLSASIPTRFLLLHTYAPPPLPFNPQPGHLTKPHGNKRPCILSTQSRLPSPWNYCNPCRPPSLSPPHLPPSRLLPLDCIISISTPSSDLSPNQRPTSATAATAATAQYTASRPARIHRALKPKKRDSRSQHPSRDHHSTLPV
jgi:hypothetical protein